MKKIGLIKRITASIAKHVLLRYKPNIEAIKDANLREAILPLLAWASQVLAILTDADPDDEKQLKAQVKLILDQSPDKLLKWATQAIEQKEMDEFKKALIIDMLKDILSELEQGKD